MARLEALGGGAGCLCSAGSDPLSAVDVHVPDQVAGDRGPAVVLGHCPGQLHMLRPHLVYVHVPALAGNIQHVHVCESLKGPRLAHQLDPVPARVSSSVSLIMNSACISLNHT